MVRLDSRQRPPRAALLLWLGAALTAAPTWAVAVAPAGAFASTPAPRAERIEARARKILADPRFQTAPGDREATAAGAADEPQAPPSASPAAPPGGADAGTALPPPSAAAPLLKIVTFGLTAVALLLLGGAAIKGWLDGWRARRDAEVAATPAAAAAAAAPPAAAAPAGSAAAAVAATPAAAADLAAAGRYDEALHALLLAAIAVIARRGARPPAPSHTSRELIRRLPAGTAAQGAFAGLVHAVERSLFGGIPAGAADYEAALSGYRTVVGPPAA
jgi:hypothetical protein